MKGNWEIRRENIEGWDEEDKKKGLWYRDSKEERNRETVGGRKGEDE